MELDLTFRITGPQSIERLEPLIYKLNDRHIRCVKVIDVSQIIDVMHFVWETYSEKAWRKYHNSALVLNRLHNSQILEDKGNYAYLQLVMETPSLETFLAKSSTHLLRWCKDSISSTIKSKASVNADLVVSNTMNPELWSFPPRNDEMFDWWAIKASKGNGGKDVWVVNSQCYKEVVNALPPDQEYIIQRYITQPLLYKNKKFHFRCYSLIESDMRAHVFDKGFILTAGHDYDLSPATPAGAGESQSPSVCVDIRKHLTNLSINKSLPLHPGQIPCHLRDEVPQIYAQICDIWRAVAIAASPFMREQVSPHHFEFFGIDIVVEDSGRCFLLEMNRLPGLESSHNLYRSEEDALYDDMMSQLLDKVLAPVLPPPTARTATCLSQPQSVTETVKTVMENDIHLRGLHDTPVAEKGGGTNANTDGDGDGEAGEGGGQGPGRAGLGVGCAGMSVGNTFANRTPGCWREVYGGGEGEGGDRHLHSSTTFRNIFNWAAFVRKHKSVMHVGDIASEDVGVVKGRG